MQKKENRTKYSTTEQGQVLQSVLTADAEYFVTPFKHDGMTFGVKVYEA